MSSPVVLILTHPADVHADAVQTRLDAMNVEVRRVDTAEIGSLATSVTVHVRDGVVVGDVAGIGVSRLVGVWHRRPSEFSAADEADRAELRSGVGGVLAALPFLNHPADMAVAFKPYQLVTAVRCGLAVPETLISTVRPVAAAMAARLGDAVVVKPMSRLVAGLLDEHDRSGWDRPAHLTQQRITASRHVRLTVVDGALFAVGIVSPYLDWRRDLSVCRYQVIDTPAEVAASVRALMAGLRLRYAALDFVVDHHDRWWFWRSIRTANGSGWSTRPGCRSRRRSRTPWPHSRRGRRLMPRERRVKGRNLYMNRTRVSARRAAWMTGYAMRRELPDGSHDLVCFRWRKAAAVRAAAGAREFWRHGPWRPVTDAVVVVSYRDFRLHTRREPCRAPDCPQPDVVERAEVVLR